MTGDMQRQLKEFKEKKKAKREAYHADRAKRRVLSFNVVLFSARSTKISSSEPPPLPPPWGVPESSFFSA